MSQPSSQSEAVPYVEPNLRPYLEMITDWAFALDTEMYIKNCYKNTELATDITARDMIGKPFCELLPRENKDKIKGLLENCRLQEAAKFVISYLDDEGHHIELNAISLWEDNKFTGYKVLMRDRTQSMNTGWIRTSFAQEQAGDDLLPGEDSRSYWEVQAKQYELLTSVSLALSGTRPFEATVQQVLKMIGLYLDADRCVVVGIDYENEIQNCLYEWHSEHTHSAKATKQNVNFNMNNEFFRMLNTAPYVGVADTEHMKNRTQFVIEDERAFMHFPIFVDDRLFGSFGIDFCREPHDWNASEISMLQTIVNCLATALKKNQAEEQFKEANDLLVDILRNYPGVIWYCDTDNKCRLIDGAGMELLGFTREMFLNKNMVEANRLYGDSRVSSIMAKTYEEGSQRLNYEKNARYLTLSTSLMYNLKGEVKGMIGVCLDITDIKKMQEKLELAITQAEEANRAKSDFLSRMSHEIRTPMNAIIGMNTIAQKTDDVAKMKYCLEKIGRASGQLLSIINDVLDIAKIEANKFELSETEFDFERMLQNVCNVIDVKIAEKKQNFIIDFNEIYEQNVIADELRLSQVLINLLTNAVKFTPDGGTIVLKIRHKRLTYGSGIFYIDISDNGIGISAEQQQRLFTSFEQGDSSITRKYGGTGLGLAICQNIIALMGGVISLKSQPGEGSCFSFQVNVGWGSRKDREPLNLRLPADDTHILVIDDSEDVLDYFKNILQTYSLSCDTARDGLHGVRMVKEAARRQEKYDLIFIDWMMPGMNGIETARTIKQLVGEETIVIMISVADWSEIESAAIEIGVDRFLAKPVLPSTLFNSIVEWINFTKQRSEETSREETVEKWADKTLLLIEDIEINREIIINMLQDTEIRIECAVDGRNGVDMYLKDPDKYDIILMDIQMPEMDGYEATRLIRGSGKKTARSVPILAMTANAFQEDVEKCLKAGMDDHIAKPVNIDSMIHKIAAFLGEGKTSG